MSINVVVNGNPVKIHKGKMVTSESPKEVDKRRKIRLQQVRQQAKDLAASVRNNVKKVKKQQQTEFEKQNQTKLKEWQNKKLIQLQNQYQESIESIGQAQKQAIATEQEENEYVERRKIVNEARASRRGQIAHELLQVERNRESLRKAIPRQTKQIAREIENTRAAMVVEQAAMARRTPKKKKKIVTKGNFTIVQEDSDAEIDLHETDDEDEKKATQEQSRRSPIRRSKPPSGSLKTPNQNLSVSKTSVKEHENEQGPEAKHSVFGEERTAASCEAIQELYSRSRIIRSPKKKARHEEPSLLSVLSVEVPPDTRISDRIKNRHLHPAHRHQPSAPPRSTMSDILEIPSTSSLSTQFKEPTQEDKENQLQSSNVNFNVSKRLSKATHQGISIPPAQATNVNDDVVACPMCVQHANPLAHSCQGNATGISHSSVLPGQSHQCQPPKLNICPNSSVRMSQASNITEIPCKPTVSLPRDTYHPQYSRQDSTSTSQQYRKVQSYDHCNRFSHNYITDTSHVQRIHRDDLIYGDDADRQAVGGSQNTGKTMTCNDLTKIATERAKLAEERGRKALEKEKIHKDYEHLMKKLPMLQKQERIANLNPAKDRFHMSDDRKKEHEKNRQQQLEHAFERLVPTRITLPPRGKSKRSPQRSKPQALSSPFAVSEGKATGTWRSKGKPETSNEGEGERSVNFEKANLHDLLEKLKNQKKELLKECKDLPQDSNFYKLIDELDFVSHQPNKLTSKDKVVQTESPSTNRIRHSTSDVIQKHKQVLILQNTSTQTSPKVTAAPTTASSSESSSDAEPPSKQPKTTVPDKDKAKQSKNVCDCKDRDKLCEILIKIRDGSTHVGFDNGMVAPEVASRLEDALNLETSSPKKATLRKHQKSSAKSGSTKSISPKRSRSESPKKTSRKVQSPKKQPQKQFTKISNEITAKSRQERQQLDSWKHHLSMSTNRPHDEITSSTSYYSPPDYNMGVNRTGANPRRTIPIPRQQENMLDPSVLTYVNKLLEMSKGKLDMLAANVTSISDVPTPTSSIINAASNRPRRTGGHENGNDSTHIEKLSSLLKYFNLTPGDLNSFVSLTTSLSSAPRTRTNSTVSSRSDNGRRCPPLRRSAQARETHLALENFTQTSDGEVADQMAGQFAQWAEVCQERISSLAAMIEQVRMEKQQMLPSPTNQNLSNASVEQSNNATTYLKLPNRSNSSSPHTISFEQRQLNSKLLDVHDGARQQAARDPSEFQQLLESSKTQPDLDRDIIERYMKLIDSELQAQRIKSPEASKDKSKQQNEPTVSFTPMLDIPKLPKFQPQPSTSSAPSSNETKPRKPPLTTNALRFNEIFHELSIIPEAENSRLSKSPQSRKSTSPQKRLTTNTRQSPTKSSAGIAAKTDKITEVSTDSPSTDKSNESVESMLKNIGLDWAIPAVKKMNAANANNNSSTDSSSFDIDMRKFSFLLSKNITSSAEKSGPSALPDLSRHHRTSTPVPTTNTNSSKKSTNRLISSGESEISPVAGCSNASCRKKSKSPLAVIDPSFNTMPTQSSNEDSDS